MKKIVAVLSITIAVLVGVLIGTHFEGRARAQAAASPFQMSVSGAHTACVVTPSVTTYCFATDGIWQSLNGGTYVQVGGGLAGVTINGKTGTSFTISAASTAANVPVSVQ